MRLVIAALALLIVLVDSSLAQCPPAAPCQSCEHLRVSSGNTLPSGFYDISPNGTTLINAYCIMEATRGWTVIDPSHDADWTQFFSSWANRGSAYGPSTLPSHHRWTDWFLLSTDATFATSENGTSISQVGAVYRMTGNYYGCIWFNGNCNFNGACRKCNDPLGQFQPGTCPYMPGSPTENYPHNCGFDWWNAGPSLGSEGHHLVAYWHYVEQPVPITATSWSAIKTRYTAP